MAFIPDKDAAIESFITINCKTQFDRLDELANDPDNAEWKEEIEQSKVELRENLTTQYTASLTPEIDEINTKYDEMTDTLASIPVTITTLASKTALPACLGAVTPNPAYGLLDSKEKKDMLQSSLDEISSTLSNVINSCKKISYDTSGLDSIATSINTVQSLISNIPI